MPAVDVQVIVQGETLLNQENIIEFDQLVRAKLPAIDADQLVEHIQRLADTGQMDRAIRLWYHVTEDHKPGRELAKLVFHYIRLVFWQIGAAGGLIYLLRMIFGL